MKNPKITEEIQVLIQRTEQYLNNIIDMVDSVYDSVPAGHDQVLMLYNYLLEILFEDFDQLKIVKIIESDEDEEIISSFRNHFVELIREIENEL